MAASSGTGVAIRRDIPSKEAAAFVDKRKKEIQEQKLDLLERVKISKARDATEAKVGREHPEGSFAQISKALLMQLIDSRGLASNVTRSCS